MEHMKERLAIYENNNSDTRSIGDNNQTLPLKKRGTLKQQAPPPVPKLNLSKALQFNMKMFKTAQ
jgi:hypothetical protein